MITLHYPVASSEEARSAEPKAIAIGHFDGVHRGHQNVIRRCVDRARSLGIQAAVMTFHPHPKEVLGQGGQYASCLTPLAEKVERFRGLGVDLVYVVSFDKELAGVTPPQFVAAVLRPLQVRHAVVGFDFTFGSKGSGTASMLRELCEPEIAVDIIEPLMLEDVKVSSTLVRESLAEGKPEEARELLGQPYAICGTVVRGEGRGRTIGFPTANIEPDDAFVIPRQGVYAVIADFEGRSVPGVLNIGVKPTFHEHLPKPVLEAHLFDFNGDLYGKTIRLRLISFLRPEKKFGSAAELVEQIHADAHQARSVCAAYN
nr:bifunctional riboflavin kinase/FAD synthetase [Paenibacillus humicola]